MQEPLPPIEGYALNEGQKKALAAAEAWFRAYRKWGVNTQQVFVLRGYAGSGKTFTVYHILKALGLSPGEVVGMGPTMMAAKVLKDRAFIPSDTIHHTIYDYVPDEDEGKIRPVLKVNPPWKSSRLIVVDEMSLVDEELFNHIRSFNLPVLAVGDPFQLSPVGGTDFFGTLTPDAELTEVVRQREGGGVLELACGIRIGNDPLGRDLVDRRWGPQVHFGTFTALEPHWPWLLNTDAVFIVYTNKMRQLYNEVCRQRRFGLVGNEKPPTLPLRGDRVMGIKNNRDLGITNGERGICTVGAVMLDGPSTKQFVMSYVTDDGDRHDDVVCSYEALVSEKVEGFRPDLRGLACVSYGYSLTAHKAQGSQFPVVVVTRDDTVATSPGQTPQLPKWQYVAVTRAQETLLVIDPVKFPMPSELPWVPRDSRYDWTDGVDLYRRDGRLWTDRVGVPV